MTREKFENTQFRAHMFFKVDIGDPTIVFPLIGVDFKNYTLGTRMVDDGLPLDWVAYGICELCDKDGNLI